jgi:pilus assembly protein Flp/PilA
MCRFAQQVRLFLVSEDGPTAVEYAVMLGLLVLACIASIGLVGSKTSTMFTNASNKLN